MQGLRWATMVLAIVWSIAACSKGDSAAACADARKQARAALEEMLTKHPSGAVVAEELANYDKNPDDGPSFMAPISRSDDGANLQFKFHPKLPATAEEIKEGAPEYLRYVALGVAARTACKK